MVPICTPMYKIQIKAHPHKHKQYNPIIKRVKADVPLMSCYFTVVCSAKIVLFSSLYAIKKHCVNSPHERAYLYSKC